MRERTRVVGAVSRTLYSTAQRHGRGLVRPQTPTNHSHEFQLNHTYTRIRSPLPHNLLLFRAALAFCGWQIEKTYHARASAEPVQTHSIICLCWYFALCVLLGDDRIRAVLYMSSACGTFAQFVWENAMDVELDCVCVFFFVIKRCVQILHAIYICTNSRWFLFAQRINNQTDYLHCLGTFYSIEYAECLCLIYSYI